MVHCHKCGTKEWNTNQTASKFCLQCGEPLMIKAELYEFRKWYKDQLAEKERQVLVKQQQRFMPKKVGTLFIFIHN
jgi:ribosomal protein L37E